MKVNNALIHFVAHYFIVKSVQAKHIAGVLTSAELISRIGHRFLQPVRTCDHPKAGLARQLTPAYLLFPPMRTIIQASSTMHSFKGSYLQLTSQTQSSILRLLAPATRHFSSRYIGSVRLRACQDRATPAYTSQLRWKSTNSNNKGEAAGGNEQPPSPPAPKNFAALSARPPQQKQDSTGYDHYEYGSGAPADTMANSPYGNPFEPASLPVSNPRMVSPMHVRQSALAMSEKSHE